MSVDQIAPEALRLPANELALLDATPSESIQDPNQLAVDLEDDEAVSLAVLRDREIESGEVAVLSHEEFLKRVRK